MVSERHGGASTCANRECVATDQLRETIPFCGLSAGVLQEIRPHAALACNADFD